MNQREGGYMPANRKRNGVFILVLIVVTVMSAGCSFSTANVKNALTTSGIGENYQPVDEMTEFALGSPIYMSAELHNAPDDTDIKILWLYDGEELDHVVIGNDGLSDTMISSYMPSEMVPQTGNYSVEVYIDDRQEPDAVVKFTVK
jgi:hypothetical protein